MLKELTGLGVFAFLLWDSIDREKDSFLMAVVNAVLSMYEYYV